MFGKEEFPKFHIILILKFSPFAKECSHNCTLHTKESVEWYFRKRYNLLDRIALLDVYNLLSYAAEVLPSYTHRFIVPLDFFLYLTGEGSYVRFMERSLSSEERYSPVLKFHRWSWICQFITSFHPHLWINYRITSPFQIKKMNIQNQKGVHLDSKITLTNLWD